MQRDIVRATYAPSPNLPVNTNWRTNAACRDEDPELFFPIGTTGPAVFQAREAKAVCSRCPVIDTCLTWALESREESGIWGGLDENQRRRLRRADARRQTGGTEGFGSGGGR
ncbi:WhiB family transcriptional regulator [Streptomyces luteireticuli]|uniref:WhiB family transcriptional regulator n=1 Tax=Streptomyces luteireticuli TaxID=173858 RepID=UPI0035581478